MTSRQNISASVKQRLLNRSKTDNRSFNPTTQLNVLITIYCGYSCIKNTIFGAIVAKLRCRVNELLQYYAMERFLYRLSLSRHAQHYILKGALMLRAWNSPEFRSTMDIDMLGKTLNEETNIIVQICDILAVEVDPDGLVFYSESIRTERITEDADYEGIRVRFNGFLGTARISMQIDIGFGDIVYPEPEMAELPCMLDFPAPSLLCYSRESAIAEKFEAMVKLGHLNSRMKDFYDI